MKQDILIKKGIVEKDDVLRGKGIDPDEQRLEEAIVSTPMEDNRTGQVVITSQHLSYCRGRCCCCLLMLTRCFCSTTFCEAADNRVVVFLSLPLNAIVHVA